MVGQWRQSSQWAGRSPDSFADVACAIGVARRIGPAFRANPDRVVLAGHSMSTRPVAVIGLTATAFTPAPGSCDADGRFPPSRCVGGPGWSTRRDRHRRVGRPRAHGILRRDQGRQIRQPGPRGIRSHWRPIAPSPPPTSRSCSSREAPTVVPLTRGHSRPPSWPAATTAGSSRSRQPITSGPPSRRSRSRRSSPWRPRSVASHDACRYVHVADASDRPTYLLDDLRFAAANSSSVSTPSAWSLASPVSRSVRVGADGDRRAGGGRRLGFPSEPPVARPAT